MKIKMKMKKTDRIDMAKIDLGVEINMMTLVYILKKKCVVFHWNS